MPQSHELTSALAAFELRLETQTLSLCPELRLRLFRPSVDLDAAAREFLAENAPFWAFCWASGQVLARWLLDHSELVRGRCVETVLIADPGRHRLTLQGLEALWECEARTVPEIDETTPGATVYRVSDKIG